MNSLYHYCMWFVPGDNCDFLAKLYKDGDTVRLDYRFRYYDPEDPHNDAFSGKDRKSAYTATLPNAARETVDRAIAHMNDVMMPGIVTHFGMGEAHIVPLEMWDSDPEFIEVMSKLPFVHIKVLEKGDGNGDEGQQPQEGV